ncbi:MAG: phytoene/squalene synthase family protein [Ferruginibacter sp.]
MMQLFHTVSNECSKITAERYSTSFSGAILLLHASMRTPVYNIYGFVRFADEIVDTFHEYKKEDLLSDFKLQTYKAIQEGISLNPILHSFQQVVNQYKIDIALVDAFFKSMEMDLRQSKYDLQGYQEYIYGSAEVVGLMCLYVFCGGDQELFGRLKPSAMALGAAFQKINFLRDIKADYQGLNRTYFPGVDFKNFTLGMKKKIEEDVQADLAKAYEGIRQLPSGARYGVDLAYRYYLSLFKKIQKAEPTVLLTRRVRIPDHHKAFIFLRTGLRSQLNLI